MAPSVAPELDTSHVQVRLGPGGGAPQCFAFAKLPHVSDDAPRRWVHMAREGTWRGHHSGAEIVLTAETFASFVASFDATKNATAAKYGHPGGDDFPAAGWILDLEVRGDGLWGLVEFTPRAVASIRDGEYRYCSIEFALESVDRVTGEPAGPVVSGLGLTNIPFLDGLTPITLSLVGAPAPMQRSLSNMDPKKIFAALAQALGLGKDTPTDQLKAAVDAFLTLHAVINGKPAAEVAEPADAAELSALCAAAARTVKLAAGDPPALPGADEPLPAEGEDAACKMLCDKLIEATGLDMTALLAAVQANLDAVVAVLTAAPSGTGLSANDATIQLSLIQKSNAALNSRIVALSSEVATLTAGNAAREAAAKEAAVVAMFERALSTGHAVESQRAEALDYARAVGVEKAEKFLLSQHAPPTTALATGPAAPTAKLPGAGNEDSPLDETDPLVKMFRLSATGFGHRGKAADAFIRRQLAAKANQS